MSEMPELQFVETHVRKANLVLDENAVREMLRDYLKKKYGFPNDGRTTFDFKIMFDDVEKPDPRMVGVRMEITENLLAPIPPISVPAAKKSTRGK